MNLNNRILKFIQDKKITIYKKDNVATFYIVTNYLADKEEEYFKTLKTDFIKYNKIYQTENFKIYKIDVKDTDNIYFEILEILKNTKAIDLIHCNISKKYFLEKIITDDITAAELLNLIPLSSHSIAKLLGVSKQLISDIKNNRKNISARVFYKLNILFPLIPWELYQKRGDVFYGK